MLANANNGTREPQDCSLYADNNIATLDEPFVVLDKTVRMSASPNVRMSECPNVRTVNTAFYRDFRVVSEVSLRPVESPLSGPYGTA